MLGKSGSLRAVTSVSQQHTKSLPESRDVIGAGYHTADKSTSSAMSPSLCTYMFSHVTRAMELTDLIKQA